MYALRVNGLVEESIVDGPGLRYAIFTQGCPHHCKGCHNPDTHSFNGGYLVKSSKILEDFFTNPLLSGISFSGGEPFLQAEALAHIGKAIKEAGKNIVVYTGYKLSELAELGEKNKDIMELLKVADILVDGPYMEELRDLELYMRGSSNQNILKKIEIMKIIEHAA